MKTALSLALIGALMAGPALARGMQGQVQDQPYSQSQQQGMSQDQMSSGKSMHGSRSSAMNRDQIRDVQQKLAQQGYNVQADGKMGRNTRQALRQFQQDQGLPASGRIDQQTMAALGAPGGTQQAQTPGQRMRDNTMPQQQDNWSGQSDMNRNPGMNR